MNFWPRLPSILMIVLALSVATVFLPGLSGCSVRSDQLTRWMTALSISGDLPEETREELDRFQTVYLSKVAPGEDSERQFDHFVDAFKVVRASYVKEVSDRDLLTFAIQGLEDETDRAWLGGEDGTPNGRAPAEKVVEVALDAMLARLDPHSGYMTPAEFNELMVDTSGEFGGLGIEIQQGEGYLKVVSPIEDTPADRAGLQPGDRITHVEGVSIEDWPMIRTVRALRGEPGTAVVVTIDRDGRAPFDVTIVRDIIKIRAVRSALYEGYLHLRVVSFSERMETDVRKAYREAFKETGGALKGVVLDLRNNPGGLLQQSVALSDLFLNEAEVVSIRGRTSNDVRSYGATDGDIAAGIPVVVLINEGSASASEIVSGALQDHNRAIVMGRRTFGKGSVQTIMPLIKEGAVRLTTSLYYLPSGRTIQQVGVSPDILLELDEDPMKAAESDEEDISEISRESDLPNVLSAKIYKQDKLHHKDGMLGRAPVAACPETGLRKDRELGCAIEFLKAGSAQKFLAAYRSPDQG